MMLATGLDEPFLRLASGGSGHVQQRLLEEPSDWATLLSDIHIQSSSVIEVWPGDEPAIQSSETDGTDGWGEDIIVTGRLLRERDPIDVGGGSSGDEPGTSTGGGEGGDGGYVVVAERVASHPEDCATEDGAAVQVAKKVTGELPADISGPSNPVLSSSGQDWRSVEFGAVIVRNSDGSYGALHDSIYSSDEEGKVSLPNPAGYSAVGFWHNHPPRLDQAQQNIDMYPSRGDWTRLASITSASNPSIWLMGPDGVTREFSLSDRATIQGLSEAQVQAGVGLEGRARKQSCGA